MKAELVATSGEVVAEIELDKAHHAIVRGHRCFIHISVCTHGPTAPIGGDDAQYLEVSSIHVMGS